VDAYEQGKFLPNRFLTQAEPLCPFPFYRPPRPGIAKYEKEHATCVPNDRGDLNIKWVVSEENKNKNRRYKHNGDNNKHSPFFEKYKAGNPRTLGIAVCDIETFD